mmetsp:Transcript_19565/g.58949  ORF Transcript_19565/g.58949 Transcript_19565/m.58949 type:complete len:240 (+) Transcript_19565:931-1650(+)
MLGALPVDDRSQHDVHQFARRVFPAAHDARPTSPLSVRLGLRLHAEGAADLQPRRRDPPPPLAGLPRGLRRPGRARALHLLRLGLRDSLPGHPGAVLQRLRAADSEVHAAGAPGALQCHGLHTAGAVHGAAHHRSELHLLRFADRLGRGRLAELVHAGSTRGQGLVPGLGDISLFHQDRSCHAIFLGGILLCKLDLHCRILQRLCTESAVSPAPALPGTCAGVRRRGTRFAGIWMKRRP